MEQAATQRSQTRQAVVRLMRDTRPAAIGLAISLLLAACGSAASSADHSASMATPSETPAASSAAPSIATPSIAATPAPPPSPIPAIGAELTVPTGLAFDAMGDLYISQCGSTDSVINRVDRLGELTRFAGTGPIAFSGDGGPATLAALGCPVGMAFGPDGGLYFADHANNRVRRIDTAGTIATVAGSGPAGVDQGSFAGDGGPAANATLQEPFDVAFDEAGNLYIADRDNQRIRMVDPDGIITTVAGNGEPGFAGDGGPAVDAMLSDPLSVAVDPAGNLLIADSGNYRVRRVDGNGMIDTVFGSGPGIGTGVGLSGDGGPAVEATLTEPGEIAFGPSGVVIVGTLGRIRRVDSAGVISSIAGRDGIGKRVDGVAATEASFGELFGIATDGPGDVFLTDGYFGVWRIDSAGILHLVAGRGQ